MNQVKQLNFQLNFLNGKAILITTFERMINGRSIFGVEGYGNRPIQRIGALVVDDAQLLRKLASKVQLLLKMITLLILNCGNYLNNQSVSKVKELLLLLNPVNQRYLVLFLIGFGNNKKIQYLMYFIICM
ncbi:hypothetical protein ACEQPO_15090 [Bacillus sp. SL00103]